jgi:hypothetical protein
VIRASPGIDVARQCLDHGYLDEILTLVAPALLGDGTPSSGGRDVTLSRRDVASPEHVANLWFDVVKEPGRIGDTSMRFDVTRRRSCRHRQDK